MQNMIFSAKNKHPCTLNCLVFIEKHVEEAWSSGPTTDPKVMGLNPGWAKIRLMLFTINTMSTARFVTQEGSVWYRS